MDTKILFCRHWWRVCWRKWQTARGKRARKVIRAEMREAAKVIVDLKKEAGNG